MKTKLIASIVALVGGVGFTGCSTASNAAAPITAAEIAVLKFSVEPATFDDAKPVFEAVFPHGYAIKKDPLDTQAEFAAKLAATGFQGKELTVLVPPDACEIFPFPEEGIYIIASKDSYYPSSYRSYTERPYGITVMSIDEKPASYVGQNTYGAKAEVTSYHSKNFKINLANLAQIPRVLRWERNGFIHFGMPVKIVSDKYRTLLREKKIGLAVRVRIDDLSKATDAVNYSAATVARPVAFSSNDCFLPATLLEAWIVDTSTSTTLVTWKPAPAAGPVK